MRKDKLQVGIVGAPRGSGFMAGFGAVTETEVVACCDVEPEALARVRERYGIERLYTDFAAMLASGIDIVVVATPMPLHVPMAVQALDAGKHVLSEVPAATDLDQCWDLVQAVRRSGRKYMMAENYCYRKPSMLLKRMAEHGLFGELYFGEGEYIHELKELNEQTKWRRRWQTGRNGNTYPTHSLGPLLQWMQDRVVSVACMGSGHHYRDPRGDIYENEDTTLTLCKLARGGLVKLRLDMLSERPHHLTYYALQGTKGCFEEARGLGDVAKVWLAEYSEKKNQWRPLADFEAEFLPEWWRNPPEEAVRAGHGGGDYFEVRDFVDSILSDSQPPVSVYEALDYTVPGLVSQESIARGGTALPVPDFREIQRYPEDLPAELRESGIRRVSG
jgi:predicted dehydrogenase